MTARRADQAHKGVRDAVNQHATQIDRLTADVETLRAKLLGALTKLDADVGINDTDYLSLWTPGAALTSDGYTGDTLTS